jgi:hypothetical protein
MKMEYNAQILRGWPYEGALDRAESIKTGVTLLNGDWVQKQADNTVDKVSATKTANAGLVVRGNGDSLSGVATAKATVLWGNFIAQIKTATVFTPGQALTVQSGALVAGVVGTDPIVGYVLDVISANATNDASVVVKIN